MGAGNTGNQFIGVAGREVKSASEFTARMRGGTARENQSRIPARVHQRKVPEGRSGGGWNSLCPGNCQRRLSAGRLRGGGGRENTVALVNAQWGGPADGMAWPSCALPMWGQCPQRRALRGLRAPKGTPGPQGEPGPQGGNWAAGARRTGRPQRAKRVTRGRPGRRIHCPLPPQPPSEA